MEGQNARVLWLPLGGALRAAPGSSLRQSPCPSPSLFAKLGMWAPCTQVVPRALYPPQLPLQSSP